MSTHNHYIGGKEKKIIERAPVAESLVTVICVCKRVHEIKHTRLGERLIQCDCGAILRYRPGLGATIETVELE